MTYINKHMELSAELCRAIDAARGTQHIGPFIESALRRDRKIAAAAKQAGIAFPDRAESRRGRPKKATTVEVSNAK